MAQTRDLVLVHINEEPGFFARIESIDPDVKRGWRRVRLLVLTVPLQVITWILREEYIDGAGFTMDGVPMRLMKVEPPEEPEPREEEPPEKDRPRGKVVPIFPGKKET